MKKPDLTTTDGGAAARSIEVCRLPKVSYVSQSVLCALNLCD